MSLAFKFARSASLAFFFSCPLLLFRDWLVTAVNPGNAQFNCYLKSSIPSAALSSQQVAHRSACHMSTVDLITTSIGLSPGKKTFGYEKITGDKYEPLTMAGVFSTVAFFSTKHEFISLKTHSIPSIYQPIFPSNTLQLSSKSIVAIQLTVLSLNFR